MSWELQRKLGRDNGSHSAHAEYEDEIDGPQERARARRVSRALLDVERAKIQHPNNGEAPTTSPRAAAAAGIASPTTAMPHAARVQPSTNSLPSEIQHKEKRTSKARPPTLEERVLQLIELVDRHCAEATDHMNKEAESMDLGLIAHMRDVLRNEQGQLMVALTHLPTGSPLMARAFESADRVPAVISRLQALGRTHESRNSVKDDSTHDEQGIIHERLEKTIPQPYCDTAPQEGPCYLSVSRRNQLRSVIRDRTQLANTGWTAAINALHIEEKLSQQTLTFEQQLGQVLFGLLFDVISLGAKALIKKGIDKADEALGTSERVYGDVIVTNGMDPDSAKLAKSTTDHLVGSASPIAKARLASGITRTQLATRAAESVNVPSDRDGFLMAMKSGPNTWAATILENVDQLFDSDLEALADGMPPAQELSQPAFENKLKACLTRFEQQVMPIRKVGMDQTRPVRVVSAQGIRYALVSMESAANERLHGEWKDVAVRTGKWDLVRWIDEDMKDMAIAKVKEFDPTWAMTAMVSPTDTSFWSARALERLAHESAEPKQQGT